MSRSNPRVLIMAGGTGGHVFPALATADVLRSRGAEIEWLGTERGIESRLVPQAGIKLNTISVQGVRGKGKLSLLLAPLKIARAIWQAREVVSRLKPSVVLGMGGFASGPGAVAAWLTRTPLVIHEQNAIAGLTNSLSRRFATRVLQAFPRAFKSGEQGIVIGNPIREAIVSVNAPGERYCKRTGSLRVLVVGGSLGALAINNVIPAALSELNGFEVWHQTGEQHLEQTRTLYSSLGVEGRVEPFIDDMAEALSWADLVICRAGALTVSEIAAVGVAALLIPFPYAVDDHQTANARYLVEAGAAELIDQASLTTDRLADWLKAHSNRDQLLEMAERGRALGQPAAANRVAEICLEVGQ